MKRFNLLNLLATHLLMDIMQGLLWVLLADDSNGDEAMAYSDRWDDSYDTPPVSKSVTLS